MIILRKYSYLTSAIPMVILQISFSMGSIHSQIKHFEILKPEHIKVRIRRSVDSGRAMIKTLSFPALSRRFNLILKPGWDVFDPSDTEVEILNGNGRVIKRVPLDENEFLSGHVAGKPGVTSVSVYHLNGSYIGHVHDTDEKFTIDSLSRHDRNRNDNRMLIYRNSDFMETNETSGGKCGNEEISSRKVRRRFRRRLRKKRNTRNVSYEKSSRKRISQRPLKFHLDKRTKNLYNNQNRQRGQKWNYQGRVKDNNENRNLGRIRHNQNIELQYGHQIFNVCDVLALMDFYTLQKWQGGNIHKAAKDMLYFFHRVYTIFIRTKFTDSLSSIIYAGMANKVRKLKIMSEYSKLPTSDKWNLDHKGKRRPPDALMSDLEGNKELFSQYCLVHQLTAYPLTIGYLGMASFAGACRRHSQSSRNIAISRMYSGGNQVSTERFVTTIAHEFGHNWGSVHDDESHCTQGTYSKPGGHFIMFNSANYGINPNNHLFSPCSREQIGKKLTKRGDPSCFMMPSQVSTCGDGILQKGELCDEGKHLRGAKRCCTDDCRLEDNASCSTSSSPCCSDSCRPAPQTQDCFPTDREIQPCQLVPKCNGLDPKVCPAAPPRADGSPCSHGVGSPVGSCRAGHCWSVCDSLAEGQGRQLEACHCTDNHHDMCVYCCRDVITGVCEATGIQFPESAPCYIGTCHHGTCYTSYYTAQRGFTLPDLTVVQLVVWSSMAISFVLVMLRELQHVYTLLTFSQHWNDWFSMIRMLKGHIR